ncbi:hypothetical protein J0H58_08265 [bacterium]|nr:hypothetical protein [bacterium]
MEDVLDVYHRPHDPRRPLDRIGIGTTRNGNLGFAFPVVIVSGVKG